MDQKDQQLREQEAPEKNTDKAYVKVNQDGSPELNREAEQEANKNEAPEEGTLKHR